jgi:hypothetical protein
VAAVADNYQNEKGSGPNSGEVEAVFVRADMPGSAQRSKIEPASGPITCLCLLAYTPQFTTMSRILGKLCLGICSVHSSLLEDFNEFS